MRLVLATSASSIGLLGLVGLLTGSGCSSSGTLPTSSSPFQGTWACTVLDTLTFTTPANAQPETNHTSPVLTITVDASGSLSVKGLVDAGATCPLTFSASGSTATLAAGQTCSSGTIALTYGQGSATVSGGSLTASIAYSFTGTVVAPLDGGTSGDEAVAGTGTSSYTCTSAKGGS
jgi:hypothetical protein